MFNEITFSLLLSRPFETIWNSAGYYRSFSFFNELLTFRWQKIVMFEDNRNNLFPAT